MTKTIKELTTALSNNIIAVAAVLLSISFLVGILFVQFTTDYKQLPLLFFLLFALVFISFAYAFNQLLNQPSQDKAGSINNNEAISFIAHELNAPLGNIKGALSVIKAEEVIHITATSAKLLERAILSLEQLIKMVDDLLLISRYDQGKMEILPRLCSLEEIFQLAIDNYQGTASEKGLTLVFNKPAKLLPSVSVDPDRIREVLENLISNAIKYTETGSISINLDFDPRNILVAVSDSGYGIPREKIGRLFQRFSRLGNSINAKGTGLGLYISRLIIEAHHGKIWVESKEGVGSKFIFSLPLTKNKLLTAHEENTDS